MLLQLKQSRVQISRMNQRDVLLACCSIVEVSVLSHQVMMADCSTVWSANSKAAWSIYGSLISKSLQITVSRWQRLVLAVTGMHSS